MEEICAQHPPQYDGNLLTIALGSAAISSIVCLLIFVFVYCRLSRKARKFPNEALYPYMLGLATGNPKYRVSQKEALAIALQAPGCAKVQPVLERVYANTKISYRHMAIPDFSSPHLRDPDDELFYPADGSFVVPIQYRLERFKEEAVPLVTDVCMRAIKDAGVSPKDIHKLIVVSSTGFLGPSLDCELIVSLGLPRTTDRTLIGFMGCAAAMNGYRVGMDYCKTNPSKLALMVCVELSSIHTTFKETMNDAVIHAIFADGAAACVMKASPIEEVPRGTLCIVDDHGYLMEGTQDGIVLAVNDDGISCTLSKHLPQYISKNMGAFIDGLLQKQYLSRADVDFWGIHPGGRRIIEEAQNGLGLSDEQAADSWYVLDNYGNMLSPAVMFVMERMFKRHKDALSRGEEGYKCGVAFSFSPGVGAEGILLRQVN